MDEIKSYVDTRYVGPPEACWRLLGFDLHGRSHTIQRLAVHLPNDKMCFFEKGAERATIDKAMEKDTTLDAWFKLNARDDEARQYRYTQIPEHYRWDSRAGTWIKRSRGTLGVSAAAKVIGRIHGAAPTEKDRFYLYLLLLHVPGATSDDDLRTPPDSAEPLSYKEAAVARGLVNDDREYDLAMQEAASLRSAPRLRELFAYLLVHCEPVPALALWEAYRDEMPQPQDPAEQCSSKLVSRPAYVLFDTCLVKGGAGGTPVRVSLLAEMCPV